MGAILTLIASYLGSTSSKANAVIPDALKSGASGLLITALTTRIVLIAILVVMSTFGAQKMHDRSLLLNYVTTQLGIPNNPSASEKGAEIASPKQSSTTTSNDNSW
jgi:fructose-specific phosphotransferase system IIC component